MAYAELVDADGVDGEGAGVVVGVDGEEGLGGMDRGEGIEVGEAAEFPAPGDQGRAGVRVALVEAHRDRPAAAGLGHERLRGRGDLRQRSRPGDDHCRSAGEQALGDGMADGPGCGGAGDQRAGGREIHAVR